MCTKRRRKFSKDSPKMPKASGFIRSGWRRWLQKCFKITKKERKNWIKQSFYPKSKGDLNKTVRNSHKKEKTHYGILDKSHNAQYKSLKMLKNHKNKYKKLDKMNILFSFRGNTKCQNF